MKFFSVSVFFHENSRFTVQQGKRQAISLTPLYHFHPLTLDTDTKTLRHMVSFFMNQKKYISGGTIEVFN